MVADCKFSRKWITFGALVSLPINHQHASNVTHDASGVRFETMCGNGDRMEWRKDGTSTPAEKANKNADEKLIRSYDHDVDT